MYFGHSTIVFDLVLDFILSFNHFTEFEYNRILKKLRQRIIPEFQSRKFRDQLVHSSSNPIILITLQQVHPQQSRTHCTSLLNKQTNK